MCKQIRSYYPLLHHTSTSMNIGTGAVKTNYYHLLLNIIPTGNYIPFFWGGIVNRSGSGDTWSVMTQPQVLKLANLFFFQIDIILFIMELYLSCNACQHTVCTYIPNP